MTNKTISINPGLFSVGGSKTKKNRDKKNVPEIKPLISPNVLKNKLLKRIKEHKQRETENLENNKRKLLEPKEPKETIDFSNKTQVNDTQVNDTQSDEFKDSLDYLQILSKQKKISDEKNNYEKYKQKRRQELERNTVKNHSSLNNSISNQQINIDLPEELREELREQFISVNTENFNTNENSIKITPPMPYGILKGGNKPTYREWSKTQRNNIVTNPNSALVIEGSINKDKSERENRLNNLREKLKLKQLEDIIKKENDLIITQNQIQKPVSTVTKPTIVTENNTIASNIQEFLEPGEVIIARKKITKKTIKRKYTLGKSKIKKIIGVLIKDRSTRKRVLNAQKELKKKSTGDIKQYLREHNLIKVGSNAPNDVLRKLYESAMLSGEITNINAETLFHNFSKDDKEL